MMGYVYAGLLVILMEIVQIFRPGALPHFSLGVRALISAAFIIGAFLKPSTERVALIALGIALFLLLSVGMLAVPAVLRLVVVALAVFVVWCGTRLRQRNDRTVKNLILAAALVMAAFAIVFAL